MTDSLAVIPRPMRLSALVIAIFTVVIGVWLTVPARGADRVTLVSDLAQLVGPLLMLPLALRHLPARWRTCRQDLQAPLWLVLGVLCHGAGQLVWTWYAVVQHRPDPFPSWADLGYLLAYPCFLLGIRHFPVTPAGRWERIRIVLDGAIVVTAVGTVSWYFLIGPTLLQSDVGRLAQVLGTAYPVGDLLLVGCALALLAHADDRAVRGASGVLALALGVIVASDSAFYAGSLRGGYRTGGLLDLGWPLGGMLVVLSVQVLLLTHAAPRDQAGASAPGHRRWHWRSMLPYACLSAVLGLLIRTRLTTFVPGPLDRGLAGGTLVVMLAVVARQVLAILENQHLHETATASARLLKVANQDLGTANARLEILATTDPVTKLPNHRALVNALDRERERAARYGRAFAVLFIDLDHFKAINDGYGHSTGDAVLAEVGRVLGAALREVDTLGRWGGEEFLAILPEVGTAGALAAAERVRHAVAQHRYLGGALQLTCSIGVSGFGPDDAEVDRLVTLADQALYTAKKLGRNQVRAASDPAVAGLMDSAEEPRDVLALAGTVEALAVTIAARDPHHDSSVERVAVLVLDLALASGLHAAEARLLALVARVRDLGKVAIPDAILQKPGALTPDEWAIVRTHPAVGADIVGRIPALRAAALLIRAHHEHWNGGGYPDGLVGAAIPLGARVLAVADAYVALTSDRPYRHSFSPEEALAIVERESGTRFDPEVVARLGQVVATTAGDDGSARWPRRDGAAAWTGTRGTATEIDWDALVARD